MKISHSLLAAVACFEQANATGILLDLFKDQFLGAPTYKTPENLDNVCSDGQEKPWTFSDLPSGKDVKEYQNLTIDGFSAQDGVNIEMKRSPLGRRTFFLKKHISCGCKPTEAQAPSISGKEGFSIKEALVSCPEPGTLKMIYTMPDGSSCGTFAPCGKEMSTITNNQCGGAKKVSFVYQNPSLYEKLLDKLGKCSINVYQIIWDCGKNKPQPPETVTRGGETVTRNGTTVTLAPPPGQTVTQPGQTVTQPGQTVTRGGETVVQTVTRGGETIVQTVTQSGQTVTKTGQTVVETVTRGGETIVQTVTQPGQTVVETVTRGGETIVQTVTRGGETVVQPPPPAQTVTQPGQTVVETVTRGGETIVQTVTQPGQTVTRGGETVVQPPQTVTKPGQTVTQPGQTVTRGGETVVQPPPPAQTVTQPGQTVTQPGQTVTRGGETIVQPPQTVTIGGPGQPPEGKLPCPTTVPSCINTFLLLEVGKKCKNALDVGCYCAKKEFTASLYSCFYAHRANDDEYVKAQTFLQGMCAQYIPQNPYIASGGQSIVSVITVTAMPTYQQTTTVMVPSTVTQSGTTQVVTSTLNVPQVVLPTAGTGAQTGPTESGSGSNSGSDSGSGSGSGSGGAQTSIIMRGTGTGSIPGPTGSGFPVTGGAGRIGASLGACLAIMAALVAL